MRHHFSTKIILICCAPVIGAVMAVMFGKEAGWDLLNYHWYVPYAWLHQRLGIDVAVAHHATYYNPLIDLPLYILAHSGHVWLVGAAMGALFGIAVMLIGVISHQVFGQLRIATVIALLAALGGGALSALGDSANDVVGALGILAALWLLLKHLDALRTPALTGMSYRVLLSAGLLAGLSVGLKLTTAIYGMGLLAATFTIPSTFSARASRMLLLGMGMLLGVMISAGPWIWQMWQYSGNPLFPYFNHWFHSPLLIDSSYRDMTYAAAGHGLSRWWFPLTFTLDSHAASESAFRDAKLLVAYVLVPVTAVVMYLQRSVVHQRRHVAIFLFTFAAISYLAWVRVFGVYRYLIPLEMLAPLLIILAIDQWPIALAKRVFITAIVLIGAQAAVQWNIKRDDWQGDYIAVDVPALPAPDRSMILMTGHAPMAFVIPSFPASIPFLRIDGWLISADDTHSGLALRMRQRVAQHTGPLLMLYAPYEQIQAVKAAQTYGLELLTTCSSVRSNVSVALMLCSLRR